MTGSERTVLVCLLAVLVAAPVVGAVGDGGGTETAVATETVTGTETPAANGTETPAANGTETPAANGTETATVNGTARATATAVGNGSTITPPASDASVSMSPQIAVTELTVDEARLGSGGFLVVKRVPEFEIIGVSSYIEPGRATDVVIELDREIVTRTPIVVEVWFDDGDGQFEPSQDVRYRAADGFPVQDRSVAAPEALPEAGNLTAGNGTAVSTPEADDSVVPELSPAASVVLLFGGTVLLVFGGGFLLYWLR